MKAIFCGKCFDMRALRSSGPVTCECGNVTGWWVDPRRGTAKIHAVDRDESNKVKIVGFHNGYLQEAITAFDFSNAKWVDLHKEFCEEAEGYLFKLRGCPIVVAGIGISNDVTWADEIPEEMKND